MGCPGRYAPSMRAAAEACDGRVHENGGAPHGGSAKLGLGCAHQMAQSGHAHGSHRRALQCLPPPSSETLQGEKLGYQ